MFFSKVDFAQPRSKHSCVEMLFLSPDNRMKESGGEGRMDRPDGGGGGTRVEGMSGHGLGYLGQRCMCVFFSC